MQFCRWKFVVPNFLWWQLLIRKSKLYVRLLNGKEFALSAFFLKWVRSCSYHIMYTYCSIHGRNGLGVPCNIRIIIIIIAIIIITIIILIIIIAIVHFVSGCISVNPRQYLSSDNILKAILEVIHRRDEQFRARKSSKLWFSQHCVSRRQAYRKWKMQQQISGRWWQCKEPFANVWTRLRTELNDYTPNTQVKTDWNSFIKWISNRKYHRLS